MKRTMRARASGFTLIELSLALVAGSFILLAIYGVFSRVVHLRDDVIERTREIRVRTHVANVIRNDLRGARYSGGTLAASLVGGAQAQSGGFPGYLRFTTTTARDVDHGDDVPSADIQEVEYYVTADPGATTGPKSGQRVRTVSGDLLAPTRQTPPEEPLLAGIESMEVTFFDGNTWQTSWDVSQDPTLPQAIRVRLQPVGEGGGSRKPAPIEVLVPWVTQVTIDPNVKTVAAGPAAATVTKPPGTGTTPPATGTGTTPTSPTGGGGATK